MYCTSCGTQIRAGTQFCVNCGASLASSQVRSDAVSDLPEEPTSEKSSSGIQSLGRRFSSMKASLSASSGSVGNTWKGVPSRFLSWFRDLPSIPKFVIIGLIGILLLFILSPLLRIVAIITTVVGIVTAAIRTAQRRFTWRWIFFAVASLIMVPIFGFTSNAFYGGSDDVVVDSMVGDGAENLVGGSNPDDVNAPDTTYPETPPTTVTGNVDDGTLDVPVMDIRGAYSQEDDQILEVSGTADTLYPEDIDFIANYFGIDPYFSHYDAILVRVQSLSVDYRDMESYSYCSIELANSDIGSRYFSYETPEGSYSTSCS